ncbi:PLDc N-terminal domain-containing protein [Agrococcus casei]|uniref:PLDc N-terminal domain-containing protein n=1 Tax=Agrococcus casei TaxID=343512 RepID=UPI003F8F5823
MDADFNIIPWAMWAGSIALSIYAIVTIFKEKQLRRPVQVLWSAIALLLIPYIGSILWFAVRVFGLNDPDEE